MFTKSGTPMLTAVLSFTIPAGSTVAPDATTTAPATVVRDCAH